MGSIFTSLNIVSPFNLNAASSRTRVPFTSRLTSFESKSAPVAVYSSIALLTPSILFDMNLLPGAEFDLELTQRKGLNHPKNYFL